MYSMYIDADKLVTTGQSTTKKSININNIHINNININININIKYISPRSLNYRCSF